MLAEITEKAQWVSKHRAPLQWCFPDPERHILLSSHGHRGPNLSGLLNHMFSDLEWAVLSQSVGSWVNEECFS